MKCNWCGSKRGHHPLCKRSGKIREPQRYSRHHRAYQMLIGDASTHRLEHVLSIVRDYDFQSELFRADIVQMLEELLSTKSNRTPGLRKAK